LQFRCFSVFSNYTFSQPDFIKQVSGFIKHLKAKLVNRIQAKSGNQQLNKAKPFAFFTRYIFLTFQQISFGQRQRNLSKNGFKIDPIKQKKNFLILKS